MPKDNKLLYAIIFLILVSTLLTIIGTATTYWFRTTLNGEWKGRGTFCRNSDPEDTVCLPNYVDALCVVSIIVLFSSNIMAILISKNILKSVLYRLSLVGIIFVASVLLLAIVSPWYTLAGFSYQLIATACAFTQLMLLISGVRLGQILREEALDTITNYLEGPLLFFTRFLTILIALFTTIGMSTSQWIGDMESDGWHGAGTFCRQTSDWGPDCYLPTITSILSVVATVLSIFVVIILIGGMINFIQARFERQLLVICLFATAVILWSTTVTAIDQSEIGYSFKLIIAAGPFVQLTLVIGGIWLGKVPDTNSILIA